MRVKALIDIDIDGEYCGDCDYWDFCHGQQPGKLERTEACIKAVQDARAYGGKFDKILNELKSAEIIIEQGGEDET